MLKFTPHYLERHIATAESLPLMEKLIGESAHFYEPSELKNILKKYGFSVEISHHKWRYTVSASL